MARIQTRRTVSVSRDFWLELSAYCKARGVSASSLVENTVFPVLGIDVDRREQMKAERTARKRHKERKKPGPKSERPALSRLLRENGFSTYDIAHALGFTDAAAAYNCRGVLRGQTRRLNEHLANGMSIKRASEVSGIDQRYLQNILNYWGNRYGR